MEEIRILTEKINGIAEIIESKKELIQKRERRLEERTSSLGPIFAEEKTTVKKHLSDLLRDVRVIWTKVKEAYSSSKLSVDVNRYNKKDFKYNENDPLETINKMVTQFNIDMGSLNSAFDLTQTMASNANGLINMLQDFIADFDAILGVYWSGALHDEDSKIILEEITDIENDIAELIEKALEYYDDLKNKVEQLNYENKKSAGDIHKKTTDFDVVIRMNLGYKRELEERVEFSDKVLTLEPLEIYNYSLYELTLSDEENNDSSMIVVKDDSLKERIKNIIVSRFKESYPEDYIKVIVNMDEFEERVEFLNYNRTHDEHIPIQIIMTSEIEPEDKKYLQNKAFIFLICNNEEAKKFKGKIVNVYSAKEDKGTIILTDDVIEIALDE